MYQIQQRNTILFVQVRRLSQIFRIWHLYFFVCNHFSVFSINVTEFSLWLLFTIETNYCDLRLYRSDILDLV